MTERADAPLSRLEAVLDEIEEYLGDRQDTRDGEDGTPLPNKAMSLLTELDAARGAFASYAVKFVAPTPNTDKERALLEKIANANVIFPSMCANNHDAYSINEALAEYKTKRNEQR